MAHFARIDENNIVQEVIVINNSFINNGDGTENEERGADKCREVTNTPDSTWIQTSYNSRIRGKFAAVGSFYIPESDVFVESCEYASWTLNTETLTWEPPIPDPSNAEEDQLYFWDEESKSWIQWGT